MPGPTRFVWPHRSCRIRGPPSHIAFAGRHKRSPSCQHEVSLGGQQCRLRGWAGAALPSFSLNTSPFPPSSGCMHIDYQTKLQRNTDLGKRVPCKPGASSSSESSAGASEADTYAAPNMSLAER